jgi:YD repeat-containing protein
VRCSRDGNGNETRYEYDPKGNLTRIVPPGPLGAIVYSPDALSRTASVVDGKGQRRTFTYDARDRVTKVEFRRADGTVESTVTYSYDAVGNLSSRTDPLGTTIYVYDERNLLKEERFPGTTSNFYSYDAVGNLASFSNAGGTTTYLHDADNLPTELTAPNGKKLRFTHDEDHRRTGIIFPTTDPVTESTTYDRGGNIKTVQAVRRRADGTTERLTDFAYTYTWTKPDGSRTEGPMIQTMKDGVRAATTTYDYDHLGRLTSAVTRSDATGATIESYRYTFDSNSNRLETADIGGGSPKSYAYNAADQLCWVFNGTSSNSCSSPPAGATTFAYDANGNLISSSDGYRFTYNARNQTASIGAPGGHVQPIRYRDVGQTEIVDRDGEAYSHSQLGLMQDGTRRYVRDDDGLALVWDDSGTWRYFVHDAHPGSIAGSVDSTGALASRYRYDPFGVLKAQTGPNSDLMFAEAQFSHSLSLYRMGEPVNLTDPTGELLPALAAVAISTAVRVATPRIVAAAAPRVAASRIGQSAGASIARNSHPGTLGYRAWGPRGFFNRGSTRIGHSYHEGRFGIAIRTTRNTRHDWLYRR